MNTTDVLGDCYAVLKSSTTSQTTVAATSMRTPSAAMALVLVGATVATFLLFKSVAGPSYASTDDDKRSSLLKAGLTGPDEVERTRSEFRESNFDQMGFEKSTLA